MEEINYFQSIFKLLRFIPCLIKPHLTLIKLPPFCLEQLYFRLTWFAQIVGIWGVSLIKVESGGERDKNA